MEAVDYILALEGGGTRCQAVVLGKDGRLLGSSQSGDVNTNFTTYALAQQSVRAAVGAVLDAAEIPGTKIGHFAQALVGPRFGSETFGEICPDTTYRYYREQDVIFARAGLYRPHGVALVAATGATAFAIRQDTHHSETFGGWGALLGDEGSAYAMGLLALRNAVRHWEGRIKGDTELVKALCEYFDLNIEDFRREMIVLAYQKPLTRVEVASAVYRKQR